MIITISGADFSLSNIGTLSTWTVSKSIGAGAEHSIPSYVDKNSAFNYTITLKDGYTFGTYSVTMGGETITPTVTETSMTINIASVTGNIRIEVKTINSSTGEEEEPGTGGDTTGSTVYKTVSYNERISSAGISKSTGEQLSSSTGYINVYNNIDTSKTYYASGYAPVKTGNNACVCYYDKDGLFLGAADGNDFGVSSANYTNKLLTLPDGTYTIKLFSRTSDQEGILTFAVNLTLINCDETKSGVNLNGTTGEYGTSTAGYVNIYNNIDTSKTYYASGFGPSSTGTAVPVCYYDANGDFIDSESSADWGISSKEFELQLLTLPTNTSTIKVFSRTDSQKEAALYN